MSNLDSIFHALSDPTRRAILRELTHGDAKVGELARPFDISLMAVSKHIRALEEAGLITRTRQGRTTTCQLVPGALDRAKVWLEEHQSFWQQRVGRLEQLLREAAVDREAEE